MKPDDEATGAAAISRSSESSGSNPAYVFGDFVLEVDRGSLTCAGKNVRLRPKAYSVLLYLVENHRRLVSRGELLESVWGDAVVTDGVVTQCLIEIRRVLGDSDQSKVRTVPRRGYVFEMPVETIRGQDRDEYRSAGSHGLTSRPTALVIGLGILFAGLLVWQLTGTSIDADNDRVTVDSTRSSPSIAVLPFADMSANQDQEYFAHGLSDEVLSQLTNARGLRVIARTSSFSFKEKDMSIAEIAATLDVSHVLQGSVRRRDDRIRVSAQLIDASTSEQIWSETFDRRIDSVFEVQEQISTAVVDRLKLSFSDQFSQTRHATPEAYSLYLQAVYVLGQGTSATSAKAESLLAEAVRIDPDNAPAWRELARLRWRYIGSGPSPQEDIDSVRDALNRSIAIDPDDPATLAYLAASFADFDGDIQYAARLYERAIALNPSDEHVLRTGLLFLTNHGAAEDAIALGEHGILRNPVCFLCAQNLVLAYFRGQRFEDAESLARSIVSIHDRGHWMVGQALLLQGRSAEALDWFSREPHDDLRDTGTAMALFDLSRLAESEKLIATFSDPSIISVPQGIHIWALAWTGHFDAAFDAFESIIELDRKHGGEEILRQMPWQMSLTARSPFLTPLHDDPRWETLATKLGVTDAQQIELNFDLSSSASD